MSYCYYSNCQSASILWNPSASSAGISGSPSFVTLSLHLQKLSSCGILWDKTTSAPSFLHFFGCQAYLLQEVEHWCCKNSSAPFFNWEMQSMPAVGKSIINQILVLGFLELTGDVKPVHLWDCELHSQNDFGAFRYKQHVWSEWCCHHFLREDKLFLKVHLHLPVCCSVENGVSGLTSLVSSGVFSY